MYESLIPWVHIYIDEANDNIKGWYWHGTKVPNDPLFPLRAFSNNVEIPVEIGERSDVANKFNSTFKNCGFTIKNNKSENIILEINVDNNWVKLYNWLRPSIIIRKT